MHPGLSATVWTRASRPQSLATRLTLALLAIIGIVISAYMVVSYRQRRSLLEDGAREQVAMLTSVLVTPVEELLRADRLEDLDETLRLVLRAPEVFAAAATDAGGLLVAGDVVDHGCLSEYLPSAPGPAAIHGAAECGAGVSWTLLPLERTSFWLLVGVEHALLQEAVASAVRRQLALLLVLATTLSAAIVLVLRRVMVRPLDAIMRTVRQLSATGSAPRLELSQSAGELVQLADLLNETSTELRVRREELVREAEERVELERRLAQTEKFAMIGRLSGGLAHELGSPLSVIAMRADVIRQHAGVPELGRQAEAIHAEVSRLSSFVQGLLHLAGRRDVAFHRVDLRAVTERAAADFAQEMEDVGVNLTLSPPSGPVPVRGQEALLRHALGNGLRNALQALREHDGPRSVHVRIQHLGDAAAVVVEDSGPGIPPHEIPRVLEPFHTTRSAGGGMGLGLPITKGIIEEHGGAVSIDNLETGGVRLTLKLPLDESDRDERADPRERR